MQEYAHARVIASAGVQATLYEDVCQRANVEACGLLLGEIDEQGNWHIAQALPLRNIYDSPAYFEFAPEDLLAVELEHPGQVVGVYHSHPTGYPLASATDRENMQRVNVEQQIPWVWLIIKGPFHETFQQGETRNLTSSIIAYHHYEQFGLQEIPIHFEERPALTCKEKTQEEKP